MLKARKKVLFTLIGIFILSTSLFIYEILVTRLFSTMLLKHLVFFTISLAILGIGVGGFIVYKSKEKFQYENLSILLGLLYIGAVVMIYKLPYIEMLAFYILVSSLPFVIGGMILSLVFLKNNKISNKLYFADLLGSTLGSILIIPLMNSFGFIKTLFIISSLALISSLMFSLSSNLKKNRTVIIGILAMIIALIFEGSFLDSLELNFTAYFTSPITVIDHLNKKKDSEVKVLYTKWDSISRTDVVDGSQYEKVIITDGGASAPMLKFDGDLEKVGYLRGEIEFLPFSIGNNDDTLIIGSGGGKDILLALLGGSKNIDAVEINPSTVDAANKFKDFNGDIYNQKGVNAYIDDGRNFIEKTDKKYNNIYLSMVMTNSVNNGGLSMSENYIYTKEAYGTYFEHLKDDGYLSFMFHDAQDMFKGINTGIEVLLDMGIKREDIPNHFVVVNNITLDKAEEHKNYIDMPIVVFKKQPFTIEEIQNINNSTKIQNRVVENIPQTVYRDEYYRYSKGEIELSDIYKGIPFNTVPSIDNKPFFFDYGKGIPLTLLTLLAIMVLASWIIYKRIRESEIYKSSLYFGAIGLGFMLIEIPLIQKSMLFLGNPTKSFSYILFSLLLSCGIGSYFSNKKIFNIKIKHRQIIFVIIPILTILLQMVIPLMIDKYRIIEDSFKLLILAGLLFPLGFFLGMAFPKGITKLNLNKQEKHIPLMWGINGIMSVTGSVLALIISMKVGFTAANLAGGLVYLSIFIFDY
ncbi:hypothetical protein KQI38_15820 [Tissierella carlieri]|uniref:Spermidine synthase n=1 Tax=Tissierella carlieri TaxID=689904 RepID=A0ABT1SFM7_9FIRM|nr:hypothetical protein [Tissierella carlieri]MBU5313490.1 hypothetical protein [Tissierella carlieri]MCQ4924722.1 hypothetical protein [Tissierella carlieri]